VGGLNPPSSRKAKRPTKEAFVAEKKLPGRGHTDVAIAVVIPPVVDVEAVLVEVADVDAVTVRIDANCSFLSMSPEVEVYRRARAQSLYPLLPEFYSGAFLKRKSPLETNKKLNLYLFRTLSESVNADTLAISKMRHLARPSRNRTFMSKIGIFYRFKEK